MRAGAQRRMARAARHDQRAVARRRDGPGTETAGAILRRRACGPGARQRRTRRYVKAEAKRRGDCARGRDAHLRAAAIAPADGGELAGLPGFDQGDEAGEQAEQSGEEQGVQRRHRPGAGSVGGGLRLQLCGESGELLGQGAGLLI